MKLKITRTSHWGSEASSPPCEGAILSYEPEVDIRTFSSFEQFDKYGMEPPWESIGTNHRVVDGYILRDLELIPVWYIEINSVEELIDLSKKTKNELIISDEGIEIYDTYRE